MFTRINWLAISVTTAVLLWTSFCLSYFIDNDIFDPRFFTYFNYIIGWTFYITIYVSYFDTTAYQFVVMFFLPIYYNTVFFVGIAIIVIVKCNDYVIIRDTLGTGLTMGDIHTGDAIVHYVPVAEILFVLLATAAEVATVFRENWLQHSFSRKLGYVLYLYVTPLVVLLLYMQTMPFASNYPVNISTGSVVGLVIGLSVFLQTIYLAVFLSTTQGIVDLIPSIRTPAGLKEKLM